jgi:alpha-beta hydrolase superfamily lysophospholipase
MPELQQISPAETHAPFKPIEDSMQLRDGTKLFFRAWLPAVPTDKALILFHRGHEHSGRWQQTVASLRLTDTAIFAWDARGHGRSDGERGTAPDLATVVKDADEFVRAVSTRHGIPQSNMIVLAHSVGAVIAAAWVHDYAPPLRGMILATPAFRVKLYVPLAIPGLRLKERFFGPGYVKSYVKSTMLTHDREQAKLYQADPLIFPQISVRMLLDLYDTSTRLIADAGAITVPTLLLTAGSDWVVKTSAQDQFFDRLSSRIKQLEILPGFHHAVFHEQDRQRAVDKVREFIEERFREPPEPPDVQNADKRGYTKLEYTRLCRPGRKFYSLVRLGMFTAGRLSRGISLGWKSGFDSGVTLDYIYENQPQGTTPLGRWFDRAYLNSIGWRGIRQRRILLERLLRETIEATHQAG